MKSIASNREILKFLRLLALAVALFVITLNTVAQPALNFKRVTVNWPTIEVYCQMKCNDLPAYNITKTDFKLYEDANQVTDFTLWCPDGGGRSAISVSLVFEGSARMKDGTPTIKQKANDAGHAFVDLMDGIVDQAAVIWFNSSVRVQQEMTELVPVLHTAVGKVPADSGAALWDGIYVGIQELLVPFINQRRAVIVLTTGKDSTSTRTPAEVIAYANRYSIRIYSIGFGPDVDAALLESIALQTGGKYYYEPSPGQLAGIYQELSTVIATDPVECVITYQTKCMDASIRTVSLQLDYCGGTDQKTKVYRAPNDTTSFLPLTMTLGKAIVAGDTTVRLPLDLVTTLEKDVFHNAGFTVLYDKTVLTFDRISATPGDLLEGVPITSIDVPGGRAFQLTQSKLLSGSGTLAHLSFSTKSSKDTIHSRLALTDWVFDHGCFYPLLNDGSIDILPKETTSLEDIALARQIRLGQNYPNPISAAGSGTTETFIDFELPSRMPVRLTVFDFLGRQVRELVQGEVAGGRHSVRLDTGTLPNGMYYYRLEAPGASRSMKMVVAR